MSKWPKSLGQMASAGVPGGLRDVEVIPADLGRELYEALFGLLHVGLDKPRRKQTTEALARYEREVGND